MAHSNAFTQAFEAIGRVAAEKGRCIVAIDGRCAAGKTTLAQQLQTHFGCAVLHMDDFFLRPEQRTAARLSQPGGNVDYERFLEEVLLPLQEGAPFSYRPYDCHSRSLQAPVAVTPTAITVVEGSYSCHESLWAQYDLHIFLDIDSQLQRQRILARNGEAGAEAFFSRWIPLEETYFAARELEKRCALTLTST